MEHYKLKTIALKNIDTQERNNITRTILSTKWSVMETDISRLNDYYVIKIENTFIGLFEIVKDIVLTQYELIPLFRGNGFTRHIVKYLKERKIKFVICDQPDAIWKMWERLGLVVIPTNVGVMMKEIPQTLVRDHSMILQKHPYEFMNFFYGAIALSIKFGMITVLDDGSLKVFNRDIVLEAYKRGLGYINNLH